MYWRPEILKEFLMPTTKKPIMSYFPKKLAPRDVQTYTLQELEKQWDSANIFVVNLPVASGKSAIAMTLAHWARKASIITPTKLLVQQYKDEYPHIQVLRAKSDYYCDTFRCRLNKRPQQKKLGKLCKKEIGCQGCNQYREDLRRARVMPHLLSNYYIYLAHTLYRDTLIIDEAHTLIDILKQMAAKKIWRFQYNWPAWVKTRAQLKDWVNSLPPEQFNRHGKASGETAFGVTQKNLLFLKSELNSYRPRYLIDISVEKYRDEEHECIKMVPLDISDAPPIMWPSQVKKIVLLSATISRKDIEQLGLFDKKIQYIQADSPIQAERRPVIVPHGAKSMALKVQDMHMSHLVSFISETAIHHEQDKGVIHATYGLAAKLKEQQFPPEISERLIFHSKEDKSKKYNEFRDSQEPKILIASGMYEGIDLPYDAGRWQVITKVPWPYLGNPAIKYMCDNDSEWYLWESLNVLLQGCWRICRTPTDFGATYVWDATFRRAYAEGVSKGMIPKWFRNSVTGAE